LTRRQPVSALPMGSYTIDGQRKATILGKIQVVTPSTPHAGIRDIMISSVLRTRVVNHVAASVSGTSSIEDSSFWTMISSGMGRMSESEGISNSDGGAPASRRCSKTGNLGCHTPRSLWMRLGFWWLHWSGLAEAMHKYQWEGGSLGWATSRGVDDDYEVCATAQWVKYYKPSVARNGHCFSISLKHTSIRIVVFIRSIATNAKVFMHVPLDA